MKHHTRMVGNILSHASFSDVWDSEVVKTHGQSLGSLDLPDVGDFVMLIITAIATPQRFYAQMPFGKNVLIEHGKEAGTYVRTYVSS